MNWTHVIWDWNGTLLDDAWLCRDVMNGMLRARGMDELTPARYRALFGFPVVDYYRRVGFDFARESFELLGTEFIRDYERRRGECRLQAGAREVLAGLQAAGLHQSVLSAYRQTTLREAMDHFGLSGCFEQVVGLDDHYAGGKTERGRRLVRDLGVAAEALLLIGDTEHDLDVARDIGAACWLVPSGNHSRERLVAAGGEVLEDLPEVLRRLGGPAPASG